MKYIFPASTPGVISYIYMLPEGLGMGRILAHMLLGYKKINKPGMTFSGFS